MAYDSGGDLTLKGRFTKEKYWRDCCLTVKGKHCREIFRHVWRVTSQMGAYMSRVPLAAIASDELEGRWPLPKKGGQEQEKERPQKDEGKKKKDEEREREDNEREREEEERERHKEKGQAEGEGEGGEGEGGGEEGEGA